MEMPSWFGEVAAVLVLSVVSALGSIVVPILLRVLKKRGIEVTAAEEAALTAGVRGVVLQVEEQKRRLGHEAPSKQSMFDALVSLTPSLAGVSEDTLQAKRDEVLPLVRAELVSVPPAFNRFPTSPPADEAFASPKALASLKSHPLVLPPELLTTLQPKPAPKGRARKVRR